MEKMCYAGFMGKKKENMKKFIVLFSLAIAVMFSSFSNVLTVSASTIKGVQDKIKADQKNVDKISDTISGLSDEQDLLEEEIADLNSEIFNMMTEISLKEDEIAEKENEIARKQVEIGQAQIAYEAAKVKEEEQYEAVKEQIRFMYENSDASVLAILFDSRDFSDFLNKADYTEKVYQYGQDLLDQYEAAKEEVQALWNRLEADKDELEVDRVQLEADREELAQMKAELDKQLEKKKAQSADYEAEIAAFKKQLSAAKKKLQQDQKELKKLQDDERRRKEEEARKAAGASGNQGSSSVSGTISSASGSELGKQIAEYACQFVGNPYVMGGTSLTNGTDCSGFTQSVYKHFGYSLPRTSTAQRSAGRSVSYAEAQPGDIFCYSGHVALYIGNGKIVHASNPSSGIKISNANYKPYITIRRII